MSEILFTCLKMSEILSENFFPKIKFPKMKCPKILEINPIVVGLFDSPILVGGESPPYLTLDW